MDLDEPIEKLVGPIGVGGQEHEEVVVAIEELPDLQQIAAEEAEDGPIGPRPQGLGPFGQEPRPIRPGNQRPGRRLDGTPHVLGQGLRQPIEVVAVQERPVALLEVQRPVGHLRQHAAAALGANDPLARLSFGQGPGGHLAGRAVGQDPVGPILVFQREPAAQLDRVDAEPLQNVFVDDRQLLHRVVDADRPLGQPQGLAQLAIGDRGNARRTVGPEIDRHAIGLLVIQGGEDALAWGHGRFSGKLLNWGLVGAVMTNPVTSSMAGGSASD